MPAPLRSAILALGLLLAPVAAQAATFDVIDAGTGTVLGWFEAPLAGGAVTAASLSVKGGTYDAVGHYAPVWDPLTGLAGIPGLGYSFVRNSAAFDTTYAWDEPLHCGIGECAFELTNYLDANGLPQWYVTYALGPDGAGSLIAWGAYRIALVPLPATAPLLAGTLALAALLGRRRGPRVPPASAIDAAA